MNNNEYYLTKANSLLVDLRNSHPNDFKSSGPGLNQVQSETELLFYEFDSGYPALIELKQMREQYGFLAFEHQTTIFNRLELSLEGFRAMVERKNHL